MIYVVNIKMDGFFAHAEQQLRVTVFPSSSIFYLFFT